MTGRGQLRPNVALGAIGSKAPIADRGGLKRGRQQSTLCGHSNERTKSRRLQPRTFPYAHLCDFERLLREARKHNM